jgi:hypothetical protein
MVGVGVLVMEEEEVLLVGEGDGDFEDEFFVRLCINERGWYRVVGLGRFRQII